MVLPSPKMKAHRDASSSHASVIWCHALRWLAMHLFICLITAAYSFGQDRSDPINIEDLLDPSYAGADSGTLLPHLQRIGGLKAYELVLILTGEFPQDAEIIAFKLLPAAEQDQPKNPQTPQRGSWIAVYFPMLGDPRRQAKLPVRFEGVIPEAAVIDLGRKSWKMVQNQNPGEQTRNTAMAAPNIDGWRECFIFVRDCPWFGGKGMWPSMIGGYISSPKAKTRSHEFFSAALKVGAGLSDCADETYRNWRGNLDMDRDLYPLSSESLLRRFGGIEQKR